jgi:hypothetical protein
MFWLFDFMLALGKELNEKLIGRQSFSDAVILFVDKLSKLLK